MSKFHVPQRQRSGYSPRPLSAPAWRSSTALSSTSHCCACKPAFIQPWWMCNGSRVLRTALRRADSGGGLARRLVRCAAWMFLLGCGDFRGGVRGCGFASNIGQLNPGKKRSGCRRRTPRARQPGDYQYILRREKPRSAIGTWSGFTAITTAIGPVLGGWLVQHASWRWVFFINSSAGGGRDSNFALACSRKSQCRWRPRRLAGRAGRYSRIRGLGCRLHRIGEPRLEKSSGRRQR